MVACILPRPVLVFGSREWLVRWPVATFLKASLLTAGCALFAGCLMVPVRTPKAIRGPNGSIKKLDVKFLAAGSTSRAEALDKLDAVNAAPGFDRFLWARWKQSTWAVAWGVGGYGAAEVGANRLWGTENLLVAFDENGKVREYRRVSDGSLSRELRALLKDEPPLDLAEPLVIQAEHRHHHAGFSMVEIILTPDAIEFREPGDTKHSFNVPTRFLTSMDSALHDAGEDNTMEVEETIHFRSKTAVGNKTSVRLASQDYITLLRYINQYCAKVR